MPPKKEKLALFYAAGSVLALADLGAFAAVIWAKSRWADVSIPPLYSQVQGVLVTAFVAAVLFTGLYLWQFRELLASDRALRFILFLGLALFVGTMMLGPIGSADNYWDTLMSRAWTVHGRNPYVTTAVDLVGDPLLPYTASEWRTFGMTYGPLWMLVSAVPTLLLKQPGAALLGMKTAVSIGYVGAGLLLFGYLRRKQRAGAGLFLAAWLLNPAALFEVANSGHGEGLLLLPLALLAIGLAEKRPDLALPGLLGASLIKIWPLLFLPALFGIRGADKRSWLRGALIGLVMSGTYAVFWDGWRIFDPLMDRVTLFNSGFFSPGFLLLWKALRLTGISEPSAYTALSGALSIALLLAGAVSAYLAYHRRISPLNTARVLLALFLFAALSWLTPWFLLTLLPFFLPDGSEVSASRLLIGVCGLAAAGFMSYGMTWGAIALLTAFLAIGWWGLRGLLKSPA